MGYRLSRTKIVNKPHAHEKICARRSQANCQPASKHTQNEATNPLTNVTSLGWG